MEAIRYPKLIILLYFFTDDTERMNFEYPPNRNLRYAPSFSIDNISYITKDRTGN